VAQVDSALSVGSGLTISTLRELAAMNVPADPLDRFVVAQDRDYAKALAELSAGRKRTHWILIGTPPP